MHSMRCARRSTSYGNAAAEMRPWQRSSQQGAALIFVTWTILLLAVVASAATFAVSNAARDARAMGRSVTERNARDSAVRIAADMLARLEVANRDRAASHPIDFRIGDHSVSVIAIPETAKVDANHAPADNIVRLLNRMSADRDVAFGLEASASVPLRSADRRYSTISQFARELRMPTSLALCLSRYLTVYSGRETPLRSPHLTEIDTAGVDARFTGFVSIRGNVAGRVEERYAVAFLTDDKRHEPRFVEWTQAFCGALG